MLKLVRTERESRALQEALTEYTVRLSCALARVEVTRAARRISSTAEAQARVVVGSLSFIAVSARVLEVAMNLPGPYLRTLDAIHVATALDAGADLGALIAYDHRLLEAAAEAGLPVLSPS